MSREKQIEEITNILCMTDGLCYGACLECPIAIQAEAIYNAGYRKQSVGEWLRYGYDSMKCSLCGKVNTNYNHNNFCPNCGARMQGGAE